MSTYMVTQCDIENEILRLSELLEEQTREYGVRLKEARDHEASYRIAYARAFTEHRLGGEKLSEETCKQLARRNAASC